MTVSQLRRQHAESLYKFDDDDESPNDPGDNDARILQGLSDCQALIEDLQRKLASLRSQHVNNVTPASRAALEVAGADLSKRLNVAMHVHSEWQKRGIENRASLSKSTLRKSASETSAELRKMRVHAAEISCGARRVSPEVNRRLRQAISAAEIALAEA